MAECKILFICIGNMCRSPMAEAIARHLGTGRVEARSAGLSPTGSVADQARTALEELGIPSHDLSSKGLDTVPLSDVDVVVSLLGPSGLHLLPRNLGARLEAWSIPDPLGEDEEAFLATARLLQRRIRSLLDEVMEDSPLS
jgi:arsenate reductase